MLETTRGGRFLEMTLIIVKGSKGSRSMSKVTLSVMCGSTVVCGSWIKEREDFEAHGQGHVQLYSKELTCSVSEEFSWILSHCPHASGSQDGVLGQDMDQSVKLSSP